MRSLGLDCGPMSRFDAEANAEVFPGQLAGEFHLHSGYGDADKLFPRNPRLNFDEACRIL